MQPDIFGASATILRARFFAASDPSAFRQRANNRLTTSLRRCGSGNRDCADRCRFRRQYISSVLRSARPCALNIRQAGVENFIARLLAHGEWCRSANQPPSFFTGSRYISCIASSAFMFAELRPRFAILMVPTKSKNFGFRSRHAQVAGTLFVQRCRVSAACRCQSDVR